MRRWTYLVCGALLLGSIATVAAGDGPQPYPQCTGKPTESDQKAAKSLFTAGQVSFNEADYKTAIQYWRDSYKRDCTAHLLLLNLARAHELQGEKREAVLALKTYLDRQPNSPDKAQIQRRIENLEASLGGPVAPVALPDAGLMNPPTTADGGPTAVPTGTVEPVPTGTTPPVNGPATSRPITPWFVVGAGGVLTLVGGYLFISGNSKISDAEKVCPNRQCPAVNGVLTAEGQAAKDEGDTGRSNVKIGGVLAGVGLLGVAGGLVWQFAFNKPKAAPANTASITHLGPSVGQGFSGLSVQGQF